MGQAVFMGDTIAIYFSQNREQTTWKTDRYTWEDDIKMAQEKYQWWAPVNMIMNLWVP